VVQRFQLHTDIIRSPRRLYGKICKYFGINTVEELIRFRQETFNNRYCGSNKFLCNVIR